MNRCVLAVIAFALLLATAPVLADDGGGRGGRGGHSNGGHGGGHNYGSQHRSGGHSYNGHRYARHGNSWQGYRGYARPAYYGYRRPAYYGYAPYYRYHNNHDDDSAAYLVGGLVVGSLLTNAYYRSQPAPYYTTQTVVQPAQVVVQPTQVVVQAQGRRLLRDLNGDCYERTTDAAGNEMRTQLPASACNW